MTVRNLTYNVNARGTYREEMEGESASDTYYQEFLVPHQHLTAVETTQSSVDILKSILRVIDPEEGEDLLEVDPDRVLPVSIKPHDRKAYNVKVKTFGTRKNYSDKKVRTFRVVRGGAVCSSTPVSSVAESDEVTLIIRAYPHDEVITRDSPAHLTIRLTSDTSDSHDEDEEDGQNENDALYSVTIAFNRRARDIAKQIMVECMKYPKTKSSSTFYMLKKSYDSLVLGPVKSKAIDLSLDCHYNDHILDLHNVLTNRLSIPHSSGIALLHGIPGTGKTSYIRYLINSCPDKKFCLVTSEMFASLSSPSMIPLMSRYSNLVLIVEDAESMLLRRLPTDQNPAISTLLNIGDGLLGDALDVQIICTFNCNLEDIDEALLRNGRLITRMEFDKLTPERANELFEHLGSEIRTTKYMSVAEVYAAVDDTRRAHGMPKEAKRGFGFIPT